MTSRCTILVACATLALGIACKKTSGQLADPGQERGPCREGGTCDEGLLCLSDLCVRPPPADCDKVAEKISYLELGNYAKPEERTAFVTEKATKCKGEHLTKEDGECILRATTRADIMNCPKPLLEMGSCERVVQRLLTLAKQQPETGEEMARMLEAMAADMVAQCEQKSITPAQEACVMQAETFEKAARCDL